MWAVNVTCAAPAAGVYEKADRWPVGPPLTSTVALVRPRPVPKSTPVRLPAPAVMTARSVLASTRVTFRPTFGRGVQTIGMAVAVAGATGVDVGVAVLVGVLVGVWVFV